MQLTCVGRFLPGQESAERVSQVKSQSPDIPTRTVLARLSARLEQLVLRAQSSVPDPRLTLEVAGLIDDVNEALLELYLATRLRTATAEDEVAMRALGQVRDVLRRWRLRPRALQATLNKALSRLPQRTP